jgi:hypothetical protein
MRGGKGKVSASYEALYAAALKIGRTTAMILMIAVDCP